VFKHWLLRFINIVSYLWRLVLFSKYRVNIVFFLVALIGGIIGYVYGQNVQMKFYKLLNLFGLIYDFFAIILLSYVILAKGNIQDAVAHYLSLVFIIFTLMFPVSFHFLYAISSKSLELDGFVIAFTVISIIPAMYVYSTPILEPLSYKSYSAENRIKILGTLLLLVGFAFQITASIADLGS
jgi:hypothetical protein